METKTRRRRRLHIGRILTATGVVVALGIGWALAGVVNAESGAALAVDVTGASNVVSADGVTCVWTVSSNVTAVNLTSSTLDYESVDATVSWTSNSSSGVQTEVAVTDAGTPPLQAGDHLAAAATQPYAAFAVQFSIPCAAVNGDVEIGITTQNGFGSGDNHFLSNGAPLPIGWVGALGLTVLAGAGFVATTRRWRLKSQTSRVPLR